MRTMKNLRNQIVFIVAVLVVSACLPKTSPLASPVLEARRLSDGFLSGTDVSVTWKDISVADQRIFAGRAGSDDALFLKPDCKRAADRNRAGIYPLRTVHRQQDVLFHLPYGRFPV